MHCFGREDYSDGYDDYAIQISTDNGRTWSKPEIRWKSSVVPEGRMRYAEPAAFFDPDSEKLIVLIDHTLYPRDKLNVDTEYGLELNIYDPARGKWIDRSEVKFPGQRTPAMSFSFPIKTARGRLLFPGMRKSVDAEGKAIHYKSTWAPVDEVVTVIGEWKSGRDLRFRLFPFHQERKALLAGQPRVARRAPQRQLASLASLFGRGAGIALRAQARYYLCRGRADVQ